VRGKAGGDQDGGDDSDDEAAGEDQGPLKTTKLYDMTMEMFGLSEAIWHQQAGTDGDDAARARHAEFAGAGDKIRDHMVAKQAAKQSPRTFVAVVAQHEVCSRCTR